MLFSILYISPSGNQHLLIYLYWGITRKKLGLTSHGSWGNLFKPEVCKERCRWHGGAKKVYWGVKHTLKWVTTLIQSNKKVKPCCYLTCGFAQGASPWTNRSGTRWAAERVSAWSLTYACHEPHVPAFNDLIFFFFLKMLSISLLSILFYCCSSTQ